MDKIESMISISGWECHGHINKQLVKSVVPSHIEAIYGVEEAPKRKQGLGGPGKS